MAPSAPGVVNPAVAIAALHKTLGRRAVLQDIHLQVPAGQSLALVGLNGAGKTTLLRCLLDFRRADSGVLRLHGIPSTEARARSAVAYLPERFQAPGFLTGLEFLRFSAGLHGQRWVPDEAAALCAELALARRDLDQPVGRLSKGTGQKLGLAACLLSGKSLYLLDEPLSGLDVQARALALQQLQRLRARGCTLLFTCHEPADIDILCDRMAVLHHGLLHFWDTPAALRSRYVPASLEQSVLACLADPPGTSARPSAHPL